VACKSKKTIEQSKTSITLTVEKEASFAAKKVALTATEFIFTSTSQQSVSTSTCRGFIVVEEGCGHRGQAQEGG
jgi:hypothetical protein